MEVLARRPLAAAAGISAALWTAFFLLFSPRFATNDDPLIAMLPAGTGFAAAPDEHLIFTNVLIGLALERLYAAAPGLPWYGLYLLATHVLAQTALLYAALRAGPRASRIALYFLWFAVAAVPFANNLQFTVTAFVAAQAGLLLAIGLAQRRDGGGIGIAAAAAAPRVPRLADPLRGLPARARAGGSRRGRDRVGTGPAHMGPPGGRARRQPGLRARRARLRLRLLRARARLGRLPRVQPDAGAVRGLRPRRRIHAADRGRVPGRRMVAQRPPAPAALVPPRRRRVRHREAAAVLAQTLPPVVFAGRAAGDRAAARLPEPAGEAGPARAPAGAPGLRDGAREPPGDPGRPGRERGRARLPDRVPQGAAARLPAGPGLAPGPRAGAAGRTVGTARGQVALGVAALVAAGAAAHAVAFQRDESAEGRAREQAYVGEAGALRARRSGSTSSGRRFPTTSRTRLRLRAPCRPRGSWRSAGRSARPPPPGCWPRAGTWT